MEGAPQPKKQKHKSTRRGNETLLTPKMKPRPRNWKQKKGDEGLEFFDLHIVGRRSINSEEDSTTTLNPTSNSRREKQ